MKDGGEERNKERGMEGTAAILDSSDGPFVRSDMGSPSGDVQTWLWRILNMANKTHTYTHTYEAPMVMSKMPKPGYRRY